MRGPRHDLRAVAFHDVTLVGHAATRPDQLKAISISEASYEYGIGLPRDDKALRDKINGILTEALGNGTWRDIYNRTLGRSGAEPNVPTVRPY